jgi:uncharacterized membrane protein YfbV (UPF0208 family)
LYHRFDPPSGYIAGHAPLDGGRQSILGDDAMRASISAILAILVLMTLGWLATGHSSSTAQEPPPRAAAQWEYHIENSLNAAGFNDLGRDGWELVAVSRLPNVKAVAVFKRPK